MLLQRVLVVGIFGLMSTGIGSAGLILTQNIDLNGTGLGAVLTLVTAQGGSGAATETGCVSWDGAADDIGACTSGFEGTGGVDEKTGAAQTLTRELSELADLDSIADLALIFNINETGQDLTVDLEDLYFTVFATDGTEIFSAFLVLEEIVLDQDDQATGTGGSGFTFVLDAAQRADAFNAQQAAGGFSSDWRVGGGFLATNFNAGSETLFLFRVPGPTTGVPEPTTFLLFGAGLLAAGYMRRRRAQ